MQLSEGGFQVVYHLGLWSQSSSVVKVLLGTACKWFTSTFASEAGRSLVSERERQGGLLSTVGT